MCANCLGAAAKRKALFHSGSRMLRVVLLGILFILVSALQAGKSSVQSKEGFYPSHDSRSGAIVGIPKQMKAQMEDEYKEAQEIQGMAAATFADIRTAKVAATEAGENMAEQERHELAKTDNLAAEAKEVLGQTEETRAADEEFLNNLDDVCQQRRRPCQEEGFS